MDNEKEILAQIIKGDTKAFEYVYEQYFTLLYNFAFRFFPDEAEEIVQDALMKVWEKREALSNVNSLKAYLYRSIRNTCLNYIKHRNVQNKFMSEAMYELKQYELNILDEEHTNTRISAVNEAINQIPEQRKKVFLMNVIDGLSAKEIGELLNISERTVHTHVYNAMKFLREHFDIGLILIILHIALDKI